MLAEIHLPIHIEKKTMHKINFNFSVHDEDYLGNNYYGCICIHILCNIIKYDGLVFR